MIRLVLNIFAPIPVGHHVTVVPLEFRSILSFGGDAWSPSRTAIVCDDDTRVVYTSRGVGAEAMTYDALHFDRDANMRVAQSQQPLRGRVVSCVVRSDHGDNVTMETVLGIEPDPAGYR